MGENGSAFAREDPARRTLADMGRLDALTGLPDRRRMDELLEAAGVRAKERHAPLCVAIADVDLLKTIEQRFGRDVADACLTATAGALASVMQEGAIVGRFGDDEFLAVLPDVELAAAAATAERMRTVVARLTVPAAGDAAVTLSVSVGVAQPRLPDNATSATLTTDADAALYAAKRSGRNRVVVSGRSTNLLRELLGSEPRETLPHPHSEIRGRETEIAAIAAQLQSSRLVTLTGPTGAGKTRLAVETARRSAERFPGGIFFIDLTYVGDPERVASTVAERIGIRPVEAQTATRALATLLQSRRTLLVLDGCGHLAAHTARLADALLRETPDLRILATSREALGASGERLFAVPPLAPEDAVRLFADRARAAMPEFDIDAAGQNLAASICARAAGRPLEIELAAARIRTLSLEDLDAALARAAGVLEWSHALLSDDERRLLHRLSVFADGWSLDAAVAVGHDDAPVFETLAQLVDAAFVAVERLHGPHTRYRLPEGIRTFAAERLHDSGEADAIARRHAAYFSSYAATSAAAWTAADISRWLPALATELENFRAALRWSIGEGHDLALGSELVSGVAAMFLEIGQPTEAQRYLTTLLERNGIPDARLAPLLSWNAALLIDANHWPEAAVAAKRAIALARAANDFTVLAAASLRLGRALTHSRSELPLARASLEEAGRLYGRAENRYGQSQVASALGVLAYYDDDFEAAAEHFRESLRLSRAIGRRSSIAHQLGNLGVVAHRRGRLDEAAHYLHDSSVAQEHDASKSMLAIVLMNLGEVELARANLGPARYALGRARRLLGLIGNGWGVANTFTHAARLALALERTQAAAELLGYADALFERLKVERQPMQEPIHAALVAALRAQLGGQYDTCYARGRSLSPEYAEALADSI